MWISAQCEVLGPVMPGSDGESCCGRIQCDEVPMGRQGVGLEGAQWDRKAMVRLDKFSDKYTI